MKKYFAVLAFGAILAVSTLVIAPKAYASGWVSLSTLSSGSSRYLYVYANNGCSGTRYTLHENEARIANSFKAPWGGYAEDRYGNRSTLHINTCMTPAETKFPVKVVLNS